MNLLALFLFLIFGFLDCALTVYGPTHGGTEINPAARFIWDQWGEEGLYYGKGLLLGLIFLYFKADPSHGNHVLWVATCIQILVALWGSFRYFY